MTETLVTYELKNDVAIIGLDRPTKRNALSDPLIRQLNAAVTQAHQEAKAGVIHSTSDHFCAGLDLAQLAEKMKRGERRKRGSWHPTFEMIARSEVPFVAALNGACIGGGLELASAAQIRVADKTTFFALPEATRGIFVGGGGAVRTQRLMGYARMADMMLTGRVLNADEGERANLCQYVVEEGESLSKAVELAERIAKNAGLVNWAICAGLPRVNDVSHEDGLFIESLIGASIAVNEDKSRVIDFVEKKVDRVKPKEN
ncbi:crotonase/enoyl-CoA hydratase family protein [Marivita sp. S6314]|uniref:crotonase/enoyl-CoA hydratase family protein n=1 Tax=Marivita sp. S6314 TaxID=2926406 RepID=UPI001FF533CC|nr:crotonase/enoyl-CoA hydratase family protein [Marivita sp. S6314]MCK0150879.1 crotonase/enoyl-CoA hydratase family protein [Marivita sp. S6314]